MKKPTRKEAIELQCHQCSGAYSDGKEDCENIKCPLYSFMPYAKKEPDLNLFKYNPRKKGYITWEESKKEYTEEEKRQMKERMISFHNKKEQTL